MDPTDVSYRNKIAMPQVIPLNLTRSVIRRTITVYVGQLCIYRCAAYARPSIQLEQINNVFSPAVGNRDADDLRQNSSALFPPEYYVDYLGNPEVMNKIGAESTYQECPDAPYELFVKTGDVCCLGLALQCESNLTCILLQDARTWLPQLSELANSGMKILIWVCKLDNKPRSC